MDLVGFLVAEGALWVRAERDKMRSASLPLHPDVIRAISRHFEEATLRTVRVAGVPTIANPPFYAELMARGFPQPIDFTAMNGIAFVDTVLVASSRQGNQIDAPLIFHETVHVVQYAILGVDQFIREYVNGWADNGREYSQIPLEIQAYEMQARFEKGEVFSVETELRRLLGQVS